MIAISHTHACLKKNWLDEERVLMFEMENEWLSDIRKHVKQVY